MFFSRELGGWVLTGYEECDAVLRDDGTYRADLTRASGRLGEHARLVAGGAPLPGVTMLGQMDGPEHARLREPLVRALSKSALEQHHAALQELCLSAVTALPAGQPFDLVASPVRRLPMRAVAVATGIRAEEVEQVQKHSETVMAAMNARVPLAHRRAAEESASWLLRRLGDEDPLMAPGILAGARSAEERVGLLVFLLNAGVGPLNALLQQGVLALAREPHLSDHLRGDPDRVPAFVDELLRHESPLQYMTRVASSPHRLRGQQIADGDPVFVMVAAANRDPQVFAEPDRMDPARSAAPARSLAYGRGPHFCIGAPLAALVASLFFRALVGRFGGIRVEPSGVRRIDSPLLRAFTELPVTADI